VAYGRGPGFVVWLVTRRSKGFVTFTSTGVAELSPHIKDAWRFPSRKAANDNVCLALGHRVRDAEVKVLSAEQI
jgi:hypothetical protein